MVIKIEQPTQDGWVPTLAMKALAKFEYVVISKTEFETPKTGVGKFGPWTQYTLNVHEYVTSDESTGEKVSKTFDEPLKVKSFMSASVHKVLEDAPLDVQYKITMEERKSDKGNYTTYVVTPLDKIANPETTTAKTTNPEVSLDEKIANLKKSGVPVDAVVMTLESQYDTTPEFIKSRYEAL